MPKLPGSQPKPPVGFDCEYFCLVTTLLLADTTHISQWPITITIISDSKAVKLLPDESLQDSVLVADVMSHDGLPVREVLTVAVRYGAVEGFTGGQFSR